MVTTLPPVVSVVLRGPAAAEARTARLDADLRHSPWAQRHSADPRLVDPQLEQAFADAAAEVREAARAQGYAAGWAEGCRLGLEAGRAETVAAAAREAEATARRQTEFAQALQGLSRAAAALEATVAPAAATIDRLAIDAAVELVELLLDRELALAQTPALDAVRRALALTPAGRPVVVRLHPDDHAVLSALGAPTLDREITLVADPSVERSGAIAECDATRVDAQLGPALARVRAVLSGDAGAAA
ncbi:MAG TPA: FliH/SctL family protein [Actinomycetes bacterium]|nr:FliH/SctL family protein [Actinomycetes bacterium]